jgi:dsDNA-specific endonuclease/ATPase MutS2
MAFTPGDHVHVAHLGKGIVREARSGERYLVLIKGRLMLLGAHQLMAVAGKGRSKGGERPSGPAPDTPAGMHGAAGLDLHGMTAMEAVEALDLFLNDALLASLPEVRVIHGRSGGRLRAAVHQRLRELPSVRSFQLEPENPGVTIVTL